MLKIAVLMLIFLFASSFASMFGLGGGILYTPFQIWFGIDFHQAVMTSLFLIFLTSLSATLVYREHRRIDWVVAFLVEIPTILGAFAGGIVAKYVSVIALKYLLIGIIFVAAILMNLDVSKYKIKIFYTSKEKRGLFWVKRKWGDDTIYLFVPYVVVVMFTVGMVISAVGISGGALKVPIMTILFGIPIEISIGSSSFMVGLTALSGITGHLSHTQIPWKMVLLFAVPVLIGGQIGSRISVNLDRKKAKTYYSLLLLIVGIVTMVR